MSIDATINVGDKHFALFLGVSFMMGFAVGHSICQWAEKYSKSSRTYRNFAEMGGFRGLTTV